MWVGQDVKVCLEFKNKQTSKTKPTTKPTPKQQQKGHNRLCVSLTV